MKKLLIIFCTLLMLILPSCHRETYEDIYESYSDSGEGGSGNATEQPFENKMIDGVEITMEYIKNEEGHRYYDGMSTDEIIANYKKAAKSDVQYRENTPLGYIVYEGNGIKRFYNKITGSYSYLCSDSMCEHKSDCIWSNRLERIEYISDSYIYFTADSETRTQQFLYRCDLQRNNVEELSERPTYLVNETTYYEPINIYYEKDGYLYFEERAYIGSESSKYLFKKMDLRTKEVSVVNDKAGIEVIAVINDVVYYKNRNAEGNNIYKTHISTLDFSCSEKLLDDASINSYNSEYILYYTPSVYLVEEAEGNEFFAYDLSSGESTRIGAYDKNYVLSGNYVYYTKSLKGEEYADDEFYDYYCYRDVNGGTAGSDGGMLWRRRLDGSGEECVLKLKYDGYPINIESYYVDGNCIYFNFYTYKEFENFYNPDFDNKRNGHSHTAVADISSGEFTILE